MPGLPSPCVRNCCLDPRNDVCLGCFRSLDEIVAWQDSDDAQREAILARARQRRDEAAQALARRREES